MSDRASEQESTLTPQYKNYKRQKCFIAYSEQAPWAPDLLSACDEVLKRQEFNLEADHACKHFKPDISLRQKALELIANARYGIYDLSYWPNDRHGWEMPRNVLIELGIAIALNRPTLLLRHARNREAGLRIPECLQGCESHIIEFGGESTLKEALRRHLLRWIDVPPEKEWWSRHCIFGGRQWCQYREAHPQGKRWNEKMIRCEIYDGDDVDRLDFRAVMSSLLDRYQLTTPGFSDALSSSEGYEFVLCGICQKMRSSSFGIYRISTRTPADAYIAYGMSVALEAQLGYPIPRILLTENVSDVPSLLSGYEVIAACSDTQRKNRLREYLPTVMQQLHETIWKPQPLPFIETSVRMTTHSEIAGAEAAPTVNENRLAELIRAAIASGDIMGHLKRQLAEQLAETATIDLIQILRQLVERSTISSAGHSVTFVTDFEPSSEVRVRANRKWLGTAIDCILKNAIDATQAIGDVARVTISTRISNSQATISIADNGPGIPAEILATVFNEQIVAKEGHGVGLLMANWVFEAYRGSIEVGTTGPGGTTMALTLPLEREPATRGQLLLADNDSLYRQELSDLLAREGYQVISVGSLAEARKVLEVERPDLVISEVRLLDDTNPADMSGLELAASARNAGVPCILLTSYADPALARRALAYQSAQMPLASDLIEKQEGPRAIIDGVARAVQPGVAPTTIAIDGPLASGKSTIGLLLARRLGYLYLDVGTIYRALAAVALARNVPINDEAAVAALARQIRIDIVAPTVNDGRDVTVLADGQDITWDIRRLEVERAVSPVSAYPGVREALHDQQRRVSQTGHVVMLGRGIGTAELPNADLKIYLDATPRVRAERLYQERHARGEHVDFEQVLAELRRRDEIDSSRQHSPLSPAADAIIIDTTVLSVEEVLQRITGLINQTKKRSQSRP